MLGLEVGIFPGLHDSGVRSVGGADYGRTQFIGFLSVSLIDLEFNDHVHLWLGGFFAGLPLGYVKEHVFMKILGGDKAVFSFFVDKRDLTNPFALD